FALAAGFAAGFEAGLAAGLRPGAAFAEGLEAPLGFAAGRALADALGLTSVVLLLLGRWRTAAMILLLLLVRVAVCVLSDLWTVHHDPQRGQVRRVAKPRARFQGRISAQVRRLKIPYVWG